MYTESTSRPVILDKVLLEGYTTFETGDYNINIIGVRTGPSVTNKFDDKLYLVYKVGGVWREHIFPITADPGQWYVDNPMNPKGTGKLVEDQYRGCFKLAPFKGYQALPQHKPVRVERTLNGVTALDVGYFGIAIHHAGVDSTLVDKWSAGCQVFKSMADWNEFIAVVTKSAGLYGPVFTYTLLRGY